MSRIFIEEVKCSEAEGGFACGPVWGPVVAETKVVRGEESFYLSLAEVDGLPHFYKTDYSSMHVHLDEEYDEDAFDELNEHYMETGEYDQIFEEKDPEWFELFRYLIYVVRSDSEECERFMAATTGKYLDEIDIPMSDVEEDRLEDE